MKEFFEQIGGLPFSRPSEALNFIETSYELGTNGGMLKLFRTVAPGVGPSVVVWACGSDDWRKALFDQVADHLRASGNRLTVEGGPSNECFCYLDSTPTPTLRELDAKLVGGEVETVMEEFGIPSTQREEFRVLLQKLSLLTGNFASRRGTALVLSPGSTTEEKAQFLTAAATVHALFLQGNAS